MNGLLKPLFSIKRNTYHYDIPIDIARSEIEGVFDESGSVFSSVDIYARFTGGYNFQMTSISSAATHGTNYRSILYGQIEKDSEGKTVISTNIESALSFKIIFCTSLGLALICFVASIIQLSLEAVWYGLGFGIAGPLVTTKLAAISDAGITERYEMFIDQKLQKLAR
ncbi:MAG: hypothetical protein JO301_07155 [Chitinophagaceae bacterium]|nr:hypothetical protein [Chitinophagaceae bacterium]